jgi:hypothetical protein
MKKKVSFEDPRISEKRQIIEELKRARLELNNHMTRWSVLRINLRDQVKLVGYLEKGGEQVQSKTNKGVVSTTGTQKLVAVEKNKDGRNE